MPSALKVAGRISEVLYVLDVDAASAVTGPVREPFTDGKTRC
ncbi:MAG TPA: hypothetical protein VFZ72_01050 [Jiangellaceae bacterium]